MYDFKEIAPSIRAQISSAGFPAKTIGWELSDLDLPSDVEGVVRAWIDSLVSGDIIQSLGNKKCGLGLLLQGEPGHGKTTLSSVIAQEVLRAMTADKWGSPGAAARRPVIFLDYPKLLRIQKQSWNDDNEVLELLVKSLYGEASKDNNVKLLILDDLGKEYRTAAGWAENTFDALLRARFNAGLPTIVTTNYPLDMWEGMYGASMFSFGHEAFIPLTIISERGDRRRED